MATLAVQARASQEPKKRYAFWETQPVSQFDERGATVRASGICLSMRKNKLSALSPYPLYHLSVLCLQKEQACTSSGGAMCHSRPCSVRL